MSEWEIMVCFCFCFCFCFIIVIWRNFLFVDRTRFFCVLCFVLHARACLTLELPVHLLFVTSCCRRVRSLYFQCTRMYINPLISRAILWTQSKIRTGSEAHTMCTRVSREKEKKELYHVCPWITYILHRRSCRKREYEKMGEERREKEKKMRIGEW